MLQLFPRAPHSLTLRVLETHTAQHNNNIANTVVPWSIFLSMLCVSRFNNHKKLGWVDLHRYLKNPSMKKMKETTTQRNAFNHGETGTGSGLTFPFSSTRSLISRSFSVSPLNEASLLFLFFLNSNAPSSPCKRWFCLNLYTQRGAKYYLELVVLLMC